MSFPYGFSQNVGRLSMDEAAQKLTEALKAEGFGILTEIDVQATLKKKLDVTFRPYRILGACNPKLAHAALETDPQIGLMLPCNAVIQETEEGMLVSIASPRAMASVAENKALEPLMEEAEAKLKRVIQAL